MVHPDYKAEWPKVQAALQALVSREEYDSWLKGLAFVSLSSEPPQRLTVSVATAFLRHWIKQHYEHDVRTAASLAYGDIASLAITIREAGQYGRAPLPLAPTPKEPKKVLVTAGAVKVELSLAKLPALPKAKAEPAPELAPELTILEEDHELLFAADVELPPRTRSKSIRIEDVMHAICRHYGLSKAELIAENKFMRIVIPRQVGMYLAYRLTNASTVLIGQHFGNRTHNTVLNGIKSITQKVRTERPVKESVAYLLGELKKRLEDQHCL